MEREWCVEYRGCDDDTPVLRVVRIPVTRSHTTHTHAVHIEAAQLCRYLLPPLLLGSLHVAGQLRLLLLFDLHFHRSIRLDALAPRTPHRAQYLSRLFQLHPPYEA